MPVFKIDQPRMADKLEMIAQSLFDGGRTGDAKVIRAAIARLTMLEQYETEYWSNVKLVRPGNGGSK